MRALAPERGKRFTTAEEFRLALSDAIVEAAPRTDAARVSELMHAIYNKAILEEAAERERFLKEVLPSFRAATTPAPVPGSIPPTSTTRMALSSWVGPCTIKCYLGWRLPTGTLAQVTRSRVV